MNAIERIAFLALLPLLALICVGCFNQSSPLNSLDDTKSEELTQVNDTTSAEQDNIDTTTPPQDDANQKEQDPPTEVDSTDSVENSNNEAICAEITYSDIDTPCETEGIICGSCAESSCGFCNLTSCIGGIWQQLEAFPDPNCHLQYCDPLDQDTCEEGACTWDVDSGQFHCEKVSKAYVDKPCNEPKDCSFGMFCLHEASDIPGLCKDMCDPEDSNCDCVALSEFGVVNGGYNPITDVGVCMTE